MKSFKALVHIFMCLVLVLMFSLQANSEQQPSHEMLKEYYGGRNGYWLNNLKLYDNQGYFYSEWIHVGYRLQDTGTYIQRGPDITMNSITTKVWYRPRIKMGKKSQKRFAGKYKNFKKFKNTTLKVEQDKIHLSKKTSELFNVMIEVPLPGDSSKYLNQKPPGLVPEVFAPGLISMSKESEFGSVFSKDGTAFFYGVDVEGRSEIRYTQLQNARWTAPKTIISHEAYGYNDPFLSPDESELYYISDQPIDGSGERKDHDIWYSKRTSEGWSEPINAGPNINSDHNEYYISFTHDGTMYFASNKNAASDDQWNFDIYASEKSGGEFQTAVRLSDAINSKSYEADVFIAPDESYIIFAASREEGLGQGDQYISFKQEDGTWSRSKNMGETINTPDHELCPFVTLDGKYFFYTSNKDIYWVDALVIQELR